MLASAQTPKPDVNHYDKDGLAFDYPKGWSLEDSSNADAQQMVLARPDSDAQIKFYIHRNSIKAENLEKARKSLVDPYIDGIVKTFERMGAHPERSLASSEIAGGKADGAKLVAVLEGEPGAAEIYWALVEGRLVVLTFFGPDKAMKRATPAWDMVRTTLTIQGEAPAQPKPSPKMTPAP
jgi:hypothetical protein